MMKTWVFSGVGMLAVAVCALLFWLGAARPQTTLASDIAAMRPTAVARQAPAAGTDPAQQTTASAATVVIEPFSSPAERDKSVAERKAVLPMFLKASGETISRMEKDLASAKDMHAAASEIAAKQAQLARIKQLQQQVLARNSDIVS
jgi:hypothetical protein